MSKEQEELVELMDVDTHPEVGMDVVIVVTTSPDLANYWETQLMLSASPVIKPGALVVAVEEDWPGGAGNGLGTLYAFFKAHQKLMKVCDVDLFERLQEGCSVGMYHTAGKGMRLAPLTFAEHSNKSAVKLPGILPRAHRFGTITILEAVIKQTAIYAAGRAGRLSVFWGDQIFIPSIMPPKEPTSHADILMQRIDDQPDALVWQEKSLDRYGIIAIDAAGGAQQVEKVDFTTFSELTTQGKLRSEGGLGLSLGSFSLSADLLLALIDEFDSELQNQYGKMDSDSHFWMPLTLDCLTYVTLMNHKGCSAADAEAHWLRMNRLRTQFLASAPGLLLSAVDTGSKGLWWDFGALKPYLEHCLQLTCRTDEGKLMRKFLNTPLPRSTKAKNLHVSDSVIVNCRLKRGRVVNSILMGVNADEVDVENSVVIGCKCSRLNLRFSIVYQAAASTTIALDRAVHTNCILPGCRVEKVYASLDDDVKSTWEHKVKGNGSSFAELHQILDKIETGSL